MTSRTLIKRSLRFHWRSHLGVVLGAAIGSAALTGALIVGDSVRESLRERALERLGWVQAAMDGGDRLFPRKLAERIAPISAAFPEALNDWNFDAVLKLPGTASRQDGTARANHVNVLGVGYWTFWESRHDGNKVPPDFARIPPNMVVLNEALAAQLHARAGDEIVLRLHKPSALSRDVPITPQNDSSVALRLKVHGIAPPSHMGDFSLRAEQTPPLNAFLLINNLAPAAGLSEKANLILAGDFRTHAYSEGFFPRLWNKIRMRVSGPPRGAMVRRPGNKEVLEDWRIAWKPRLEDVSLELRTLTNQSALELRSDRIFLEPAAANCVFAPATNRVTENVPFRAVGRIIPGNPITNSAPDQLIASSAQPLLTYFVNQFRAGERTTPYSMVTAAGPPWTPADMRDDEILVNEWLANDLQMKVGDSLDLTYFLAESGAQLIERTNRFHVRAIVPLSGLHGDRTLMPEFPGLAKAESTREWDAGFPLVHKIRDKDEQYWKQYRGTPKAFITLRAGQAMWGNRFGNLTAIRFPVPAGEGAGKFRTEVENTLNSHLDPAAFGLRFERVRDEALRAANESQDFGGLFIGFSFFLIIAALILMGLLFAFGVQQRATEIGTLLALGFTPKHVRKLFLLEGAALAFIGSVIGVVGGIAYARAMLHGLTTIWKSATNTSALSFHVSPATVLIGLVSGTIVALITIWLVLRRQARQSARALLAGDLECGDSSPLSSSTTGRPTAAPGRGWRKLRVAALQKLFGASVIAWSCLVLAVATIAFAYATGETTNPEYFFSAGSLALIAGLAFTAVWLRGSKRNNNPPAADKIRVSLPQLLRNAAGRRRSRSVATVALIASGVFLIASIGAFRLDADANAWKRSSGTGGFALIGESTLPILKDLNTADGRDALGLDEKVLQGVSFVPFRVREGDDASCLNLNRAQQPRLLGVKPEWMRNRFTFAAKPNLNATAVTNKNDSWSALAWAGYPLTGSVVSPSIIDQTIPAIGDAASIQWALHKKIGDTITYQDERGNNFDVRLVGGLANSILQGSLIIDETEFTRRFPSVSGYRMFLIDCPSNRVQEVSAELTRALQDYGFEVTPAAQRLAAFNAVQNTYLNTFQVLGGLGLLLGSFGLGIVVLRNVLERRGELALFIAVGFRRSRVQRLVLGEHAVLLSLGLVIGIASALVAILPSLHSPRAELPVASLALTLGGVLLFGLISTWLATRTAVKGNLLEGLRNE